MIIQETAKKVNRKLPHCPTADFVVQCRNYTIREENHVP